MGRINNYINQLYTLYHSNQNRDFDRKVRFYKSATPQRSESQFLGSGITSVSLSLSLADLLLCFWRDFCFSARFRFSGQIWVEEDEMMEEMKQWKHTTEMNVEEDCRKK